MEFTNFKKNGYVKCALGKYYKNVYQVLEVLEKERKLKLKNIKNKQILKLPIVTCYKVKKNGHLFNLKNNKKNNMSAKKNQQRDRNIQNLKIGDTVYFKNSPINKYSVVYTGFRTCWILPKGFIDNKDFYKKGIEYHKLKLDQRKKDKLNISKDTQETKQQSLLVNENVNNKLTSNIIINTKSGKKIKLELFDYDEIETIDVEKIVVNSHRLT